MKEPGFGNLKRLNMMSLSVAIPVLCLPAAFFGVKALLPVQVQNGFFEFMGRHPVLANLVTYSFYFVAALGVEMCIIAGGLLAVLLFFRGVPVWLKAVMAILLLAALHGIITVRHALGR